MVAESESEEIDDELLLSQIGDENEQKQVKIEGKNYLLTKETDDVGFSYVAVQPMNVFTDRLRIHLWGIGVFNYSVLCSNFFADWNPLKPCTRRCEKYKPYAI